MAEIGPRAIDDNEPGRIFTKLFVESQTKAADTLLALAAPLALQTRAPTGNRFGPVAGELLSSPITFQVRGSTVRSGTAACTSAPWISVTNGSPTTSNAIATRDRPKRERPSLT